MSFFYFFELLGTLVFALSGAELGLKKRMDIFGVIVLAFATAIGGGSLRDALLGIAPVSWTRDVYGILAILAGSLLCYFFRNKLASWQKIIFLLDSIGLALFTIVGIEKALSVGTNHLVALIMGVMTAAFGGLIRDVLANEIPVVLQKEVYATAALTGGIFSLFCRFCSLQEEINVFLTCSIILGIRYLAVKNQWSLPR